MASRSNRAQFAGDPLNAVGPEPNLHTFLRDRDLLHPQFQYASLFVWMQDFPEGIDALQGVGDVAEIDRIRRRSLPLELANGPIQCIQLSVESFEFVGHESVLVAKT